MVSMLDFTQGLVSNQALSVLGVAKLAAQLPLGTVVLSLVAN